jgi:hypothetical protein
MRSLWLAAAAAALLAIPATAGAGPGGAPAFHDHGTFSEVDTDFCGTGETVNVAGRFNFKGWIAETGGDPTQEVKTTFNYSVTVTNPDNGKSVVDSAAGSVTNEIVVGTEDAAHTHRFVENGLRAKLKLANGRVLTHDAGQLIYEASFDADGNFVGIEVISVHGPHPAFESDIWCESAIEALGL